MDCPGTEMRSEPELTEPTSVELPVVPAQAGLPPPIVRTLECGDTRRSHARGPTSSHRAAWRVVSRRTNRLSQVAPSEQREGLPSV
jgi:hypothetical protein